MVLPAATERAERRLRQVLTLVPDHASVLANLAAARFRQDKLDQAAATARRTLAIAGGNSSALLTPDDAEA